MATQKPISTISYNTESFLREKLDSWIDAHIIQAYQYICHKGEDGDKDHIHLRVEPNKKIDQMDLSDSLKEYILGEDKPRSVRPWRPSKEEDWILYAVHEEKYLKTKYSGGDKGEKLPYKWQDIKVSQDYDIEIAYIRAMSYMEHTTSNMASRIKNGDNALNLILEGENVFQVNAITRALASNDYERLNSEFVILQEQYDMLLQAISNYGLAIVNDDEGHIFLEKVGEN